MIQRQVVSLCDDPMVSHVNDTLDTVHIIAEQEVVASNVYAAPKSRSTTVPGVVDTGCRSCSHATDRGATRRRRATMRSCSSGTNGGASSRESGSRLPPAPQAWRMLIAEAVAESRSSATYPRRAAIERSSPPCFKVGRRVLYDRDELNAWLMLRRRRSISDQGEE